MSAQSTRIKPDFHILQGVKRPDVLGNGGESCTGETSGCTRGLKECSKSRSIATGLTIKHQQTWKSYYASSIDDNALFKSGKVVGSRGITISQGRSSIITFLLQTLYSEPVGKALELTAWVSAPWKYKMMLWNTKCTSCIIHTLWYGDMGRLFFTAMCGKRHANE